MDRCNARQIGNRDGTRDQRYLRTQLRKRSCDGMALLAGGAVGDVTHRIDRLMGGAGGNDRRSAS